MLGPFPPGGQSPSSPLSVGRLGALLAHRHRVSEPREVKSPWAAYQLGNEWRWAQFAKKLYSVLAQL
uniref:Uncharacterized protein n=1 Tax=Globodera rostochiensis TaxID=31243 RepID=A0A914HJT6_GLORO